MNNNDFLCYDPAVYVVGDRYEIVFKTEEAGAAWVLIDGVRHTDNYGGVVRSSSKTHKIYVQTIYPALKYIKKGKGLRIRAILFIQSSSEIF